jgi:hypothetical protein
MTRNDVALNEMRASIVNAFLDLLECQACDQDAWTALHRTLIEACNSSLPPIIGGFDSVYALLSYACDIEYQLTGGCEHLGKVVENMYPERMNDSLEMDALSARAGRRHMLCIGDCFPEIRPSGDARACQVSRKEHKNVQT